MKMIDVMKRLAELDATNSSIEKSNLAECGPMGMMDSIGGAPNTPASINMTAATGEELSGMLKDIMSLAGLNKVEPDHLGMEPEPTIMTAEPVTLVGPTSDTEVMRGVIDRLNPEMDDEHSDELGSFQQDDGKEDDEKETAEGSIGAGLGGLAGGSIGKMGGAALGGMLGGPIGAALGGVAGDVVGTGMGSQAGDKMTGEEYDNSPADPRKPPPFKANQFANQENQPGQGDRMDGTSPKAYADMNEAVADLFAEYKKFVGESRQGTEEGIEDRLKDLDPKNPVNVPAYQRKAASGDSAAAVRNVRENADFDENEVVDLLRKFDENMNQRGGYGDPDYKKIITALKHGDVESAVEEVWYNYSDQDGGEIDMDAEIQDLQANFEHLVQGGFDPLKHVKNPTQGEKDAAKDVNRGSYADRAAMLRSAEADGRLKSESAEMADILKLSGLK